MEAVVVAYNSEHDLRGFFQHSLTATAFERIIVVDNGSRDQSVSVARANLATTIDLGRNTGYAYAANVGARATAGEWFFLVNPDIRLRNPGDVRDLTGETSRCERVGVGAPQLVLPSGQLQDSARSVPTPLNLIRRRLSGHPYGAIWPDSATDVPWVVGACMLIRRAAFEEVGGFDSRFPLYFEDVDFCVRLWQHSWRVKLFPSVRMDHAHRAASRRSLLGSATRRHLLSAARYYARHPSHLLTSALDLQG